MISIVTITFNNFEELIGTLDSVKNLSRAESVVVNGGSCAKTLSFLQSYSGIKLSEKDRGISDAFNKGLALSKGSAVMFLNSGDVLLDKDYIAWADQIFANKPEIDFTYSGIIFNDAELGHVSVLATNAETRSLAKGMPYPHQTLIVRKEVFQKLGNFDESFRYTMDFDLVLRMKKSGCVGEFYPSQTVLMDGSGASSQNDLKVIIETFKAIKKNQMLSVKILARLALSLIFQGIKKSCSQLGLDAVLKQIKKNRHRFES